MSRAKPANSCLIISPGSKFGSSFTPGKPPTQGNEGHFFAIFSEHFIQNNFFSLMRFPLQYQKHSSSSVYSISRFMFWLKISRWVSMTISLPKKTKTFCCSPLVTNWSYLTCLMHFKRYSCGLHFFNLTALMQTDVTLNWNISPAASQHCPLCRSCQLRSLLSGVFLQSEEFIYLFVNLFRDVFMFVPLMHWMYQWNNKKTQNNTVLQKLHVFCRLVFIHSAAHVMSSITFGWHACHLGCETHLCNKMTHCNGFS